LLNSKIAVVGAGVSGLAAAVSLVERGFENITLFEARREAGGRTRSWLDPATGDVLDNGQHLLIGCYRATLAYLESIGSLKQLERRRLSLDFHESGASTSRLELQNQGKPAVNLLGAVWKSDLLSFKEKCAATWLGIAIHGSAVRNARSHSAIELFKKFRQPDRLIRRLWEPIVLATINAPIHEASAELFINVFREAFLSGPDASDLLIPSCGLSELLVQPAIDFIATRGVHIRRSTPVRSIEHSSGSFLLKFDGGEENFESVIYSNTAKEPLPERIRSSIPEFQFSPIVNAYFWLDRRVLSGPIHAMVGTTLQWVFPKASQYSAQRLALTVSAAGALSEKSNQEIEDVLWNDLKMAIPQMKNVRLLTSQIVREKRATPLFTYTVQRLRPSTKSSIPRFYFSGDFVQNGLPATIEGAIRNGYAASAALLNEISHSTSNE